jgi:signal transduction histidine kinase/ActR/RegA family two-component response regulator
VVDQAEGQVPRQFSAALEEYLGQPDGKALHNGYQAGRRALLEGAGFVDLVAAFQNTLAAALAGKGGEEAIDIAENGIRFLTNALAPLETMVQAHRDTAGRLQRMNAVLQATIAERTGELEQRNRLREDLLKMYQSALFQQLSSPGSEGSLMQAYECGRQAYSSGLGIPGLMDIHHEAMVSVLVSPAFQRETRQLASVSQSFLAQALMPFEMVTRGFKEANDELRSLNQALGEARSEAERANQAKSEFLSRMSHELRTPLNAVLGFAQLLGMDNLTAEQSESVTYILKGSSHLLTLINEVLDIASIESGRMTLSPEPFLAREIIGQAVDLVHPLAAERHIQVKVGSPERDDIYIQADSNRLNQVLLNLLSNGVKYNHQGGQVEISWAATPEGRVLISVSDTGPGIPPDKLARLFHPFDRLGAESTEIEGTGLGLALSRALVEAMGGSMGVQSVVGQGSTFWLELPRTEKPADVPSFALPAAAGVQSAHMRATIVYIEDNLSNVALVTRLLARYPGVQLLPAMQGQLGLELVRQNSPELVILDLHLPDMSGEVVLRRLQEDPRTRDIPVVLFSAEVSPRHIQRLLAAGARAYLTKPIDVREFLRLLQETLPAPPEESHGQRS